MLLLLKSEARSDDGSFVNGLRTLRENFWGYMIPMTDHNCWCLIALELVLEK